MMRNGNLAEAWNYLNTVRENRGLGSYATTTAEKYFWNFLTLDYIREFVGEGQKFFYFKRRNMGFDNDYNGRKEIKVLVSAGFLRSYLLHTAMKTRLQMPKRRSVLWHRCLRVSWTTAKL